MSAPAFHIAPLHLGGPLAHAFYESMAAWRKSLDEGEAHKAKAQIQKLERLAREDVSATNARVARTRTRERPHHIARQKVVSSGGGQNGLVRRAEHRDSRNMVMWTGEQWHSTEDSERVRADGLADQRRRLLGKL